MFSNPLFQKGLMPLVPTSFPHGGGIEAAAKRWGCNTSDILDLSTGLHPQGTPDWLGAWLAEHVDLVAQYPDMDGEPARSELAKAFGLNPENVWIVAGAQAVIEVVFQAMRWRSMAIEVPCYNEPIRCAQRADCAVYAFESGDALPPADMLWMTSPSNPYGKATTFPHGRSGVLDESYMPFAARRELGLLNGVIRLGSLTKTFCIPGLRLGYVIADKHTIDKLKTWLSPWPAPTLGLHLLPKLLAEADTRDTQLEQSREKLTALLETHGWTVSPSQASFVLARPAETMPDFATFKILVRHFPEWPQLSGWVRLGFPHTENDWQRLEKVLISS